MCCLAYVAGPHEPYIPLIESEWFTGSTVRKLNESGKVNGMMVVQTNPSNKASYPPSFSSDAKCPNEESSIYVNDRQYTCDQHQFNPKGNELMFRDMKIPVVLLQSEEEVDRMMQCYVAHNIAENITDGVPTYPLCAVELKAFMNGAGNTEICWRRNSMIRNFAPDSYCQELGGYSSLAFLESIKKGTKQKKTIVVTARSDAFSLFEGVQPGTSSPVAGLTTLLAVAEALSQNKEDILAAGYNVLFLALTGEAFDYIGSQKLVYDMQQGFFPNSSHNATRVFLSDMDLIVELSQFITASDKIFAHVDPNTNQYHTNIDRFIAALKSEASVVTVQDAKVNQPLPPSSAQMFIRANATHGAPAVVIADYDESFDTKYYNSYLDTPEVYGFYTNRSAVEYDTITPQANLLRDISTTVSRAIYKYATSKDSQQVAASNVTTNRLLYCFLITRQCELFYSTVGANYTQVLDASAKPFSFYVSVYSSISFNQFVHRIIKQLLARFTGRVEKGLSYENCTTSFDPEIGTYVNGSMVDGKREAECIISTAWYHNATSPAFEIADYNFSSTVYSTWTESVWPTSAFRVRLFLKPSAEVELASMVAGISIFVISAIVAVLIQKRAGVLFPPHDDNVRLIAATPSEPT